jgi:hypothetical protein
MKWTRSVRGSTSAVTALPLIVIETFMRAATVTAVGSRASRSPDEEMIRKAVLPGLTRLDRPHQGVAIGFPVLPGVAVLRVVTAAHLAAMKARPEVHPSVTGGDALVADI